MIVYDKLFQLFKERKITSYSLKKMSEEGIEVISQGTYTKLSRNENVETSVLNRVCKFLDCQPADIMEYVPDEEEPK